MDSLDELREWSGNDARMMRDMAEISRFIDWHELVGGNAKTVKIVTLMRDYIIHHRNLKYLEEMAGDLKCRAEN